MKVAALDLGSNTFLMLIAEVKDRYIRQVYCDETRVVRLAQGVHESGRLSDEALARAEQCFAEYKKIIQAEGVTQVVAAATSAARDAKNGQDFLALGKRYGIPIVIIPGSEEAAITFKGATFDQDTSQPLIVIDVGGGSTEVIGEEDGRVVGASVNVGSVRLTEMFISRHPVPEDELNKLRAYAREQFSRVRDRLPRTKNARVVAVAGTPTSLACVQEKKEYDEGFVHRYELRREQVQAWIKKLAALSVDEREKLPGMPSKRAEVMVAGCCILDAALETLGAERLVVSTKGVRYGVAMAWEKYISRKS